MRLKTFQAQSMPEAMRLVKEALGDDAIIVSSRKLKDEVKVTAVLDETPVGDMEEQDDPSGIGFAIQDTEIGEGERFDFDDRDQDTPSFEVVNDFEGFSKRLGAIMDYNDLSRAEAEQEIISQLMNVFIKHGLSSELSNIILTHIESSLSLEEPRQALEETVDALFNFYDLPEGAHKNPIVVVGEPGSGKTLSVAKMAAKAVINDMKPCVISFDTVRAGGIEQLAAFTTLLKLPLIKVNSPDQLKDALKDHADADQIIIDSPGINPFDADEMKSLYDYISVCNMDMILAMPAGNDSYESSEVARAFSLIGARYLLPTRVDIARRIGGLLTAAYDAQMAFIGLADASSVADGLKNASPLDVVNMIIPEQKAEKIKQAATQRRDEQGQEEDGHYE